MPNAAKLAPPGTALRIWWLLGSLFTLAFLSAAALFMIFVVAQDGLNLAELGWSEDQFLLANLTAEVPGALLGLIGLSLLIAAISRRPAGKRAWLAIGTVACLAVWGYHLFGYDLSYSGVRDGIVPDWDAPWWEGPSDEEYLPSAFADSHKISTWLDLAHQSLFNLTAAILLCGLCAGFFRTPVVLAAALGVAFVGQPLIVAWIWGGGWLEDFGAVDDGSVGTVHLLAGACALPLILAARFLPPQSPYAGSDPSQRPPLRPGRGPVPAQGWRTPFAIASLFLLAWILGPSLAPLLLESSNAHLLPPIFFDFAVGQYSGLLDVVLILSAGLSSLLASLLLAKRSRLLISLVGILAGWAASGGGSPATTLGTSIGIGVLCGVLSTMLLYFLDSYRFDDPIGLIPSQLLGGMIGLITTGLVGDYSPGLFPQLLAILTIFVVGFTIGGVIALAGWLTGYLWKPVAYAEPTAPCP